MVHGHALKPSKTIKVGIVVTAGYANSCLGVIDYIVQITFFQACFPCWNRGSIYLSFFLLYVRE